MARTVTTRLEELLETSEPRRTRAWLAEQMGVSRQVLHRWLKGVAPMPRARVLQAASLLEVPIEEISEGV